MAATVKTILRKDKRRADGTCPVYVRITVNRKTRLIGTKVYVGERDWNPRTQRVRSGHDLADAYNGRIIEIENDAKEVGLSAVSADVVKRSLKKGSGRLINDLDDYIGELTMRGQEWERKHFRVLRQKLLECFGDDLTWEQLDSRSLTRFEQYMREERENSNNTIRNEMKRLRRLFKRALAQGMVRVDQDPFLAYRRPKPTQPDRRRLNKEEIEALTQVLLPDGSGARIARDAFLFSFYGGGVRFGDICLLTCDNIVDGRLVYRMMKTKQKASFKLPAPAMELIEPYRQDGSYLFPFIESRLVADEAVLRRRISSRNVIVNRNLKKVAEMAGVRPEGLTMHVARHSFANIARTASRDLHAISRALGHSDLKTTEAYLDSFDQDSVDKLSDAMFGS